ncbi:uncharacterized protein LOC112345062 isoform X2 [Selaginella moellendorffii]|uniref:uncharacterized protein LOC112345062 isoform X2 n=1 Tax=Selaginella moellendorffii TaxID=88036 RepID=UPI000D1C67D7|nr:uncharacterized protein LOC112345062 isoform X2 [Selaginella moellendorffii]|eukprot:XP_024526724.1 uncharacterized protein LOC112345062 isoform X2 [Selaginella moellendorffii]
MEEAEPEPPSEEEVAEEKKIDEDNAWIVKTLEDHDTREDLEQRVIQHIMQDPIIFRSLRNTLRIAEGNRLRHRKSLKKEFYDMEKVWSTADLMKETENALVHSDMRHRIYQLYCELRAAQSNKVPRFSSASRDPTPTSLCYWESDERYKMECSLEKELLSDLTVNRLRS